MDTPLTAIELTGTVDAEHHLQVDEALPIPGPKRVRVIVLYDAVDDWNESEWLQAAARNPSFEFLKDAREDIYALSDGKPFDDKK